MQCVSRTLCKEFEVQCISETVSSVLVVRQGVKLLQCWDTCSIGDVPMMPCWPTNAHKSRNFNLVINWLPSAAKVFLISAFRLQTITTQSVQHQLEWRTQNLMTMITTTSDETSQQDCNYQPQHNTTQLTHQHEKYFSLNWQKSTTQETREWDKNDEIDTWLMPRHVTQRQWSLGHWASPERSPSCCYLPTSHTQTSYSNLCM